MCLRVCLFFSSDHQCLENCGLINGKETKRQRILAKLQVSIDIDKIQLPKHMLSIPLEHVTLSNSHILSHLHNSILTMNTGNWKAFRLENIFLYRPDKSIGHQRDNWTLRHQKELFMVTMSCNMKWNFQYQSCTVYNNSCFLLSEIPPVIYNVDSLHSLLTAIDKGHLCIGNPDTSYVNLAHKRKFLDQSGN